MATVQLQKLVSIVPGNALVGADYPQGGLELNDTFVINQLQGVMNGDSPSGSNLIFELFVDGSPTGELLIILDGDVAANVDVSPNVQVYAGTSIWFRCIQVGSATPGSWGELRIGLEHTITL